MPLAICALPPPGKPKQQGPNAEEELQEKNTSILQEGRKREKKLSEGL
jgi:hypothetical protein